ncbi:hypothetical protein [Vibrio sp. D431a]|uniref:hypothetical protein n=1 Tax=Vibrio sp. D431a TaxID=2837388 RepID=UPI0025560B9F|nr:hypothetical protein [Vibrio sp. D431a]MDK9793883.1 hypothetical protein [Vibrio sp. D431a]
MTFVAIEKRIQNEARFNEARHSGASPVQADIISKRVPISEVKSRNILNAPLENIDLTKIKDLDKTSNRLIKALRRGEQIAIVTDFNTGSLAAAAILDKSLVDLFGFDGSCVKTYVGSNVKSKQGLNKEILNRVFDSIPKPTLVVCIGMSSVDMTCVKDKISSAKKEGVVLDFIWCGNSKTATEKSKCFYSMVNPQQDDCLLEDKQISDTSLSVLLMTRTRKRLIDSKILSNAPKMGELIPIAACCHIQHTSSLLSPTNRSLTKQAYSLMLNPKLKVWKAFRRTFLTPFQPITSQDVSKFIVDSIEEYARRDGCPYSVLKFFRSDNELEALRYLKMISKKESSKSALQESLMKTAMFNASRQIREGRKSLFIYLQKATPELQLKITQLIQSKYSLPTCIVAPEGYKEIPVSFDELSELNVDPFKGMKAKENIQIKPSSKQLKAFMEKHDPTHEVVGDYMLVAERSKKAKKPIFKLYSLEPYEEIAELDYKVAAKISPKNIFQGIKKGIYSFQTTKGDLILDLQKAKEPSLHIKKAVVGRATTLNYKGIMASELTSSLQKISALAVSDDWVNFNLNLDEVSIVSELFFEAWDKLFAETAVTIGLDVKSDGRINPKRALDFLIIDEIKQLEPFGKGFEYPVYEIKALCHSFAKSGNDLRLKLEVDHMIYNAIWVDFYTSAWTDEFKPNIEHTLLIEPRDSYKDDKRLLLPHIVAIRNDVNLLG